MKFKSVCFAAFSLVSAIVFASADDVIVTVSTDGPDTYLDGSPVIDGEFYALVWAKKNIAFEGFAADGSLNNPTNNALVVCRANASGSRCPCWSIYVEKQLVTSLYKNGYFSLCLMDTRDPGNLLALSGKDAKNVPSAINGWHVLDRFTVVSSSSRAVIDSDSKFKADEAPRSVSSIPAEDLLNPPEITSFKINGDGTATIKVKNTSSYLGYEIAEGESLDKIEVKSSDAQRGGGEKTFTTKSSSGNNTRFFRVVRSGTAKED